VNIREGMRRIGILLGVSGGLLGGFLAYSDAQNLWTTRAAHKKFEFLMTTPTMQKVAKDMKIDYDALAKQARAVYSLPAPGRGDIFDQIHAGSASATKGVNKLADQTIDYDALAKQAGAVASRPAPIDYDALAKQARAISSLPSAPVAPGDFMEMQRKGTQTFVPPRIDEWEGPAIKDDENGGRYLLPANPLLRGNRDGINTVHVDPARMVSSIELSTGELITRTEAPHLSAYLLLLLYPVLGFLLPWGGIRILTWVGIGFAAPQG
jgi:hypothetical protein